MTKISDLTELLGAGVDQANDLLTIVDMSETGAARNKKIKITQLLGLVTDIVGLLDFKGSTDCSTNPNYPAASKGDFYLVSVAGKIGGASGIDVTAGDAYFATADNAGGTQAGVGSSWTVIQGNITYAPVNKAGDTMTGDLIVPDEVYDATNWDGNLEVPTKNAVRDKIEAISAGSGITVEDEGVSEGTGLTTLNFTGAGVSVTVAGSEAEVIIPGGGASSGNLIGIQTITATGGGTYTPTAGTASVIIQLQAAGGGGGGIVSPGGGNRAMAAGGSGGGWLRKRLTANFSGASYSVGAKGAGGAAGNNNGAAGGNTTFTDTAGSPTTYTATGGGGGGGGAASATVPQVGAAVAGGDATGGDENMPGGPSSYSNAEAVDREVSGAGGHSRCGFGGMAVVVNTGDTTTAGNNATGKGSGGSGAAGNGTGVARAGGDGADGQIVIWEYS